MWTLKLEADILFKDFASSSPFCLQEVFLLVLVWFWNWESLMFKSIFTHRSTQAISINSSRVASLSFRKLWFSTWRQCPWQWCGSQRNQRREKPSHGTQCLHAPAPDTSGHLKPGRTTLVWSVLVLAAPCGSCDLSSPTKDWTWTQAVSAGIRITGRQGNSLVWYSWLNTLGNSCYAYDIFLPIYNQPEML